MEESLFDARPVRREYAKIGAALCATLLTAWVMRHLWIYVPEMIWGEDNWFTGSSWGIWCSTLVTLYLTAIPVGLLILRTVPAEAPPQGKLGGRNFWVFLLIGFFLMYTGSIAGTLLSWLISGGTAVNSLDAYAMDTNPLKVLFMVILAPLIEEYVFRKQLIDRTRRYGEKSAVFLSALLFGLFHENLFQFFYAFLLGWVFGYIYIRTGRLRYTVLMHAIVNFLGSVVAPFILSLVDLEALANVDPNMADEEFLAQYGHMLAGVMVMLVYILALIGVAIAGLVLLIVHCRKLVWRQAPQQLPRGTLLRSAYLNVGMIALIVLTLVTTVLSVIG